MSAVNDLLCYIKSVAAISFYNYPVLLRYSVYYGFIADTITVSTKLQPGLAWPNAIATCRLYAVEYSRTS